jgi:twitching motility protein PilI
MARDRNRLLNFQASLGERLRLAAAQPKRDSRLAVIVGDRGILLELDQIAEVSPIAPITPVPFTKSWFLGVANIRGTLYAVSDLPAWIMGKRTGIRDSSRIVLLGQRLARMRTAVLVDRVVGLRLLEDMQPNAGAMLADWEVSAWTDRDGMAWHAVDLGKLVVNDNFLQVVQN